MIAPCWCAHCCCRGCRLPLQLPGSAAAASPPDLLLLDMQLPDGDGASLLQALRAHS